jgi:hypothetical protein
MKYQALLLTMTSFACASAAEGSNELFRQATDPTASLMALNFQTTWIGGYHGSTPPGEADDALQFTYDWGASRWLDIPIGFQLGKVVKLGGLPARFAINPQYNLKDDRRLSSWQVTFTFTALFPSF